jgi:hypothetical protein
MSKFPTHLKLTPLQAKRLEASTQMQMELPTKIDFLFIVQSRCGITYNYPWEKVLE